MSLARTGRLLPLLLALMAASLVTGCTVPEETGRYSVTLITEQRHVLEGGRPVVGETVVAGGTVVLADGAEHRGSVTVLAGEALISGRVVGDVTVLGGEAALTGTAEITGDVVEAGGEVTLAPAAVVRGSVTEEPGPATVLQRTDDPRSPAARALWSLLGTAVMAGLAWLVASLLPRPLHRTAAAATRFPVVSGALGALVLITALPLLVSMVFTLLLVPVAGIVLLGLGAAAVLGLLAIGRGLGVRLLRRVGRSWPTPRAAALGTAVLVAALQLVGLVPVVGAAVLLAALVVSVGAVFLTGFGLRWYTPPDDAADGPGTLEVRG